VIDPGETDHPTHDAPDIVIVTQGRSGGNSAPAAAVRARPRLGVAHLLVWIGCCAVFLGLARGIERRPSGTLGAMFLTLVAASYGAAGAGLTITLARTVRGAPWSIEPGQWLLAILGVVVGVEVLGEIASPRWLRDPQAVVEAAAACAFVVPLLDRRLAHPWKWLFGALALAHALPLLLALLAEQTNAAGTLLRVAGQFTPRRLTATAALAALVLAIFDRLRLAARCERGEERGWLHWTGIATALWIALLPVAALWVL
jgi:hypothetical protein